MRLALCLTAALLPAVCRAQDITPDDLLDQVETHFKTVPRAQALADSRSLRQAALLHKIPYYTTLAGAIAAVKAIEAYRTGSLQVAPLQSYVEHNGRVN